MRASGGRHGTRHAPDAVHVQPGLITFDTVHGLHLGWTVVFLFASNHYKRETEKYSN